MSNEDAIPQVVSRSLPEANREVTKLDANAGVVSIGEPGAEPPYGFDEDRPQHLRLEFHDVAKPDIQSVAGREVRPPRPEDVEELLGHASVLRTADLVYCHCNAGVSRSTASAFILLTNWHGEGSEENCLQTVVEERPRAAPNPLLVQYADDLLEREGAMVDAVDRITPTPFL